jgi:hypothetical protein
MMPTIRGSSRKIYFGKYGEKKGDFSLLGQ